MSVGDTAVCTGVGICLVVWTSADVGEAGCTTGKLTMVVVAATDPVGMVVRVYWLLPETSPHNKILTTKRPAPAMLPITYLDGNLKRLGIGKGVGDTTVGGSMGLSCTVGAALAPCTAMLRAAAKSLGRWNRRAGSFMRALRITCSTDLGMARLMREGLGGGSCTC